MHDLNNLLDLGDAAVSLLSRRGYDLDIRTLRSLAARRSELIREADALRATAKRIATDVRSTDGGGRTALVEEARDLKRRIHDVEHERQSVAAALETVLLEIPNLPDARSPNGDSEDFAVVQSVHGTLPSFDFAVRDHVDIGSALGILDLEAAVRMAGPRFAVLSGVGASLERALATYLLDRHVETHGYTEKSVPFMVGRGAMTATGQLPKFEEDLFRSGTAGRPLYLIPTAEVPLTNLFADSIVDHADLPIAVTAHTPCFRSEAGSHGRDTRGLIRLHQFSKVELVRVCVPEDAESQLEVLLEHAASCLRELGLPYRVVTLAAGDTGFSAALTYDLEVWFPSQARYREISSVSTFGDFQARRARIRYRDEQGRKRHPTTLNGSALPIGRTIAAILENGQRADGSVVIPDVLVPYFRDGELRAVSGGYSL